MKTIFACDQIKMTIGDRVILNGISFQINEGDCIGIVGDNGAGKTTLMKMITKELVPDAGRVIWHWKDIRIGYLRQSVEQELENWDQLSGGERTKKRLIQIWESSPQLLLLDEPTNHLDQAGVQWLIRELNRFQGTIMLISHDRYFLDQVVNRIIEIKRGESEGYRGNYSQYREEKNRRWESLSHQYREEEKERMKIEREIRQLRTWSAKGHRDSTKKDGLKEKYRTRAKKKDKRVKAQIYRLEKLKGQGLKKPVEEQKISFEFAAEARGGKRIIEARDVTKRFGEKIIFKKSSFTILSGERIGLIGPNGCGKTTLIRSLLGEFDLDEGKLHLSPSAKAAVLHQDVLDLEEEKTVLGFFDSHDRERRGKLQTLLTNMGFSKTMMNQKLGSLSLGERTRLKVAEMIVKENNLLILDEPTNHLDLHSREMLEKTLMIYTGTLIVVSHDRYFLEKLCEKLLVFEDGKIQKIEMNYREYLARTEKNVVREGCETEESLRIENQIAEVLSRLSLAKPESEEYRAMDEAFQKLLRKKRESI
ncbi:ABC-F type ribosomal protection protein [Gottschalkiaceae bacterium SANA]|nr:ABC-F type ribosomal protection protein [Gottschalkiaceae bacterium SANA]